MRMQTFKEVLEQRGLEGVLATVEMADTIITQEQRFGLFDYLKLIPIVDQTNFTAFIGRDENDSVYIGTDAPTAEAGTVVKKSFAPKAFTTVFKLSKQELYASGINWQQYVGENGRTRILNKIIKQILSEGTATGVEGNAIQSIIKTAELQALEAKFYGTDATYGIIEEDTVKKMRNKLLDQFASDANMAFVIPAGQVHDVIKSGLTRDDSAYSYDNLPKEAYARIFGKPVYNGVLGTGTEFAHIIAIAMAQGAYGLAMSDIFIQAISADTNNGLQGTVTFVARAFVDGKVIDDNSIKLLGFDAASTGAPVKAKN